MLQHSHKRQPSVISHLALFPPPHPLHLCFSKTSRAYFATYHVNVRRSSLPGFKVLLNKVEQFQKRGGKCSLQPLRRSGSRLENGGIFQGQAEQLWYSRALIKCKRLPTGLPWQQQPDSGLLFLEHVLSVYAGRPKLKDQSESSSKFLAYRSRGSWYA